MNETAAPTKKIVGSRYCATPAKDFQTENATVAPTWPGCGMGMLVVVATWWSST
jgi:hypothetical protein